MPEDDKPPRARLLLADDDRLILATLGQGLHAAGYRVATVESGKEALAAAQAGEFDLAILDIHMPNLSGIEVARKLRDEHNLNSLFLTAYSDEDTVAEAVREGALGYLVKPVDPIQLTPAVEAALARTQDLRALRQNSKQLEHALAGGRATNVAIGLLMERKKLDRDAATQLLRDASRNRSRRMEDVAEELLMATDTLNRLGDSL